jgi:hypothetical protein
MFEALIPSEWSASVAALEPLHFWLLTGLAMAVASSCFFLTFRFLHRARLIEDTPTSKVRSAAQGYVELEGRGEMLPGEPILAPLTGTRCLWFSYKVEERESETSGGSGGKWRVLRKGTSTHLFRLVDESGECLIDPEGAEIIPSVRDEWYGDSERWMQGPAPRRGWAQHFATSRYRYTEQRIHPSDTLHAIGWFTTDDSAVEQADRDAELRLLLSEWKRDQKTLLARFDNDGDGVLDAGEWESAVDVAREQLQREETERRLRSPHHLMSRPRDGRAYLVSTLPQHLLVRRYRRYSFVALLFFFLGGAVAAWLWSIHFTLR